MATVAERAATPAVCTHGSSGQHLLLVVTINFLKKRKALENQLHNFIKKLMKAPNV